jgi:hypothetical protein
MSSHAANYGLSAPFTTIALFGVGQVRMPEHHHSLNRTLLNITQIGERILQALTSSKRPGHTFKVIAFIPPNADLQQQNNITIKTFDAKDADRSTLAKDLNGVDAVISALNGPALEAQAIIQDAAADAGVKRFYPSEFGFHQIYRKPNDPMGYIHPAWNTKAQYVCSILRFQPSCKDRQLT